MPLAGVLLNPFRPLLLHSEGRVHHRPTLAGEALERFYDEVERLLCNITMSRRCDGGLDEFRAFYHAFALVYEPLWHEVTRGAFLGAADTRVPTHSVFDHLYASASAVNLSGLDYTDQRALTGESGWRVRLAGFLVYVGWRGLREWLRGSRKLGDAWAASWLATAMIWRAIGGLVWELGPDVLVYPGFRWNPFYLALLRARLGEHVFDDGGVLGRVAREYYLWDGFPYYAYLPAEAVLYLPVLGSGGHGGSHPVLDALRTSGHDFRGCNSNRTGERVACKLQRMAQAVKERLEAELRKSWAEAVEAVEEAAGGVFSSEFSALAGEALELVRDEPPMGPLVVVIPIALLHHNDSVVLVVGDQEMEVKWVCPVDYCIFPPKREGPLRYIVEEAIKGVGEVVGDRHRFQSRLLDVLASFAYALGFYELVRERERRSLRPSVPGWARVSGRHARAAGLSACIQGLGGGRGAPRGYWEYCSVCRRGVAAVRVPGRELPGGEVSEEYRRFAYCLCNPRDREVYGYGGCWKVWRPVFKPGETLCPYCLVKRLTGLPEVFRAVARRLVGYEPAREVRFPSTDDIAGLATKVAVLELAYLAVAAQAGLEARLEAPEEERAKEVLGGDGGLGETVRRLLERLAEEMARAPYRSMLYEKVRRGLAGEDGGPSHDLLLEYIDGRWWTPPLLYRFVLKVRRLVESLRGAGSGQNSNGLLRILAGALLFADYELRDLLDARPRVAGVLRELSKAITAVAEDTRRRERGDPGRRLLSDIAEAVGGPRLYYGIISFDVDGLGKLVSGLVRRVEAPGSGHLAPGEYRGELVEGMRRGLRAVAPLAEARGVLTIGEVALEVLSDYLAGSLGSGDPVLRLHEASGASVLVTPSYHQAVANSVSYTLHRVAVAAGRLGGVPVYVAGDEGVIVAPAWMPGSLVGAAYRGYGRAVANALREAYGPEGEKAGRLGSGGNPAGMLALLVPRLLWGYSSVSPGFHPVRRRGRRGVVYRVPALAGTSVSVAVRFSHYMDHLYAELEAAEAALGEAKGAGGSMVAVSMGRASPARPGEGGAALLPLAREGSVEEAIRSAGAPLAAAMALASAVERGVAAAQLLRGLGQLLPWGLVEKARADRALALGALKVLAERHSTGWGARVIGGLLERVYEAHGFDAVEDVLAAAAVLRDASSRRGL